MRFTVAPSPQAVLVWLTIFTSQSTSSANPGVCNGQGLYPGILGMGPFFCNLETSLPFCNEYSRGKLPKNGLLYDFKKMSIWKVPVFCPLEQMD